MNIMPEGKGITQADEKDLLQRAQRLDESALSEIFDAYYEPLYRYVCRHIGISPAAEDLVADVFRRFLEELKLQRGPTSFLRAWLYRVAHNLVVDELRRYKHQNYEPLDEDQPTADPEVVEQVQQSLMQQMTYQALQQLTEKQRSVLILKYLQGLEIEEIAQVLKMSTGTVKALQHRGLQTMRRYLNQIDDLDETDL
jgi:RNA polymerase sigma-70 factor (ECF subfamily)